MGNFAVAVSTIVLILVIMSGGLLHALVPHSHGDDHGTNRESPVWESLHQAINHEDKRVLASLVATFLIIVTMLIFKIVGVCCTYMREVSSLAQARDPGAGELLRRGIHRYRAFG